MANAAGDTAAEADQEFCVKLKNPIKYRLVQATQLPWCISTSRKILGIGYQPNEAFSMFIDAEYNSEQFIEEKKNNAQGNKVPGYWLLNASAEYDMSLSKNDSVRSVFFIEGRNLLNAITKQAVY